MLGQYSKKVTHQKLPDIDFRQRSKFEASEKHLLFELQTINNVLASTSFKLLNNYLFSDEPSTEQLQKIAMEVWGQQTKSNQNYITHGFPLLNHQNQQNNFHFRSIKQRLDEKLLEKIHLYDHLKKEQLAKYVPMQKERSQTAQQPSSVLLNQRRNLKAMGKIKEKIKTENAETLQLSKISKKQRSVHTIMKTQERLFKQRRPFNFNQALAMIHQYSQNLISIWLPPSTYPQFFGFLTFVLATSARIRCKINKYYFLGHSLSKRLFNSILIVISEKYKIEVSCLQIFCEKRQFNLYFEPYGWKMKSWEGLNKIMGVYWREGEG